MYSSLYFYYYLLFLPLLFVLHVTRPPSIHSKVLLVRSSSPSERLSLWHRLPARLSYEQVHGVTAADRSVRHLQQEWDPGNDG
jgi:hypothetical protein